MFYFLQNTTDIIFLFGYLQKFSQML